MRVLEILIYSYFFIDVFRLSLGSLFLAHQLKKHGRLGTLKMSFLDNILWIAPVVYFTGGLS